VEKTAAIVKKDKLLARAVGPSRNKGSTSTTPCPTLSYACAGFSADFHHHPCFPTSLWPCAVPGFTDDSVFTHCFFKHKAATFW